MTTTSIDYDLPRVTSREEWREARLALLAREKELTRARDALSRDLRALPLVAVEKPYQFDGPGGPLTLLDMFNGRRQLIVYHFMFFRDKGEGCPGCSHMADYIPHLSHLHARDTSLVFVSRAPVAEIAPFRARMGWSTPWYSSFGSDFNYDFHATTDEAVAPVEYNYRDRKTLEVLGQTYHVEGEQPGASVFLRDGAQIYHSYSTYGRGLDQMIGTHNWLDITPFGRGEGKNGTPDLGVPLRHHDRYDS
ncbi:MAG: DUF899 domain-containing protein [Gemmatimonadaceae bacterium]